MPTRDKEKIREQQRRWRESNRCAKNSTARRVYAQMDEAAKQEQRARKREREKERARRSGFGRRYPAPRSLREWVRHLRRQWSPGQISRARRLEAYRDAMRAHDEWIESLDRRRRDDDDVSV
jgi:hypothetical protein